VVTSFPGNLRKVANAMEARKQKETERKTVAGPRQREKGSRNKIYPSKAHSPVTYFLLLPPFRCLNSLVCYEIINELIH
jgi:hypothetical protein